MRQKIDEQKKARDLRTIGWSIKEIAKELGVSQASVSSWVRTVVMSEQAKKRLLFRKKRGTELGLLKINTERKQQQKNLEKRIQQEIENNSLDKKSCRLLCAFLYWGEGTKSGSSLAFINSDPRMVKTFLFLLRRGFNTDEKKFRALVHLHQYHDEQAIKAFWSEVTSIPLDQFTKSYLKQNTAKNIHKGYKGSIKIKYYDSYIFKEIEVLYREFFLQNIGT